MGRLVSLMCVLVAVSAVLVSAPPRALAAATTTGIFLDGDPNEWVSAGNQWIFAPPDDTITTVEPDTTHSSATFHVNGTAWRLSFNAPVGQVLTIGTTYVTTSGFPVAGKGVLWVGGDGRGCSQADGSFTVNELSYDGSGNVTVFAANFSQQCDDGRNATLLGAVRFNSVAGLKALAVEPDQVDFGDTTVGVTTDVESVVIRNGGTDYIQFSNATLEGSGAAAFDIVHDGCTVIAPREACTIEVAVSATTRGSHLAILVTHDSTDRRGHEIALETATYVPTTTSIEVTDAAPDGYSGPEVLATVNPAPTGGLIRYRWTNGADSDSTTSMIDAATGTNTYPLSLPPGPWQITAEFLGHDYYAASTSESIGGDVNVPTSTKLQSDETPDEPGSSTHLTATAVAAFGLQLPAGTLTIRDEDGSVLVTDSVGGSENTVEKTICCLALGDHEFTAEYSGSGDGLSSEGSFVQRIEVPVPPVGSVTIDDGAATTASASVTLKLPAIDDDGRIYTVRISNDGLHWYTNPYVEETLWSLSDPDFGGTGADGIRTVYAQFADWHGYWSDVASDSIVLDLTPPSTSAPAPALGSGSVASDGKAPVALAWAGIDATSGVASYQLERRVDGGSWVAAGSPTAATSTQVLNPGHSYEYRVRAIDKAGNIGSWRAVRGAFLVAASEASGAIRYSGTWSTVADAAAVGGKLRRTSAIGAGAAYQFTGRSASWVGTMGPTYGKVKVYVDGAYVTTVDLYRTAPSARKVLFTRSWGVNGPHTIKLVNQATAGHPGANVDSFFSLDGLPVGSVSAGR